MVREIRNKVNSAWDRGVDLFLTLREDGLIVKKGNKMTVKELIEILKTFDPTKTVSIEIERGFCYSGSDEINVVDGDTVCIVGDETYGD
jgi:hypothetical protein